MDCSFFGEYPESRGKTLTTIQWMIMLLRFLGNLGYQNDITEDIVVSRGTVAKTVPFWKRL